MKTEATARDVMEMMAASGATHLVVTPETVVSVLRRLADSTEKASPETREAMAAALAVFLSATFEMAAKAALGDILERGAKTASEEEEEEDDGLD